LSANITKLGKKGREKLDMRTILVFGTSGCGKGRFLEQLKSSGDRISAIELEPPNWNTMLAKPA